MSEAAFESWTPPTTGLRLASCCGRAALGCRPRARPHRRRPRHGASADADQAGQRDTVEGHPWAQEVVNLVWTPPGSKIAAIVEVRPVVLHPA